MSIAIVGAGGIGSWLAFFLYNLLENSQISDRLITFYDHDVIETKNIRYQNFGREDITDSKVASISARYGFAGVEKKIEDVTTLDCQCIVSAVDNKLFREQLFNNFWKKGPYWIDLRSEGRIFGFYTKHTNNTLKTLLSTLPKDSDNNGSCQLQWELENNVIQQGNKIIAAMGSQLILNWHRKQDNPASQMFRI